MNRQLYFEGKHDTIDFNLFLIESVFGLKTARNGREVSGMKFYPLTKGEVTSSLAEDYKNARAIGVIRLGKETLYFKAKLKVYYIPYSEIRHCFRRVQQVPAKMCCGRGDFEIESLVIGDESAEQAVIQLPGTRAARELIKELKELMPGCDFSAPKRSEGSAAGLKAENPSESLKEV